jgi:hypothetical protein
MTTLEGFARMTTLEGFARMTTLEGFARMTAYPLNFYWWSESR